MQTCSWGPCGRSSQTFQAPAPYQALLLWPYNNFQAFLHRQASMKSGDKHISMVFVDRPFHTSAFKIPRHACNFCLTSLSSRRGGVGYLPLVHSRSPADCPHYLFIQTTLAMSRLRSSEHVDCPPAPPKLRLLTSPNLLTASQSSHANHPSLCGACPPPLPPFPFLDLFPHCMIRLAARRSNSAAVCVATPPP